MNLQHIDLEKSNWAQSLFCRMKFIRDDLVRQEKFLFLSLSAKIFQNRIYMLSYERSKRITSLVHWYFNLDQTPTKYVPGSNKTMALKGSNNVPITRSTDKRMITATFMITLNGKFLPLQLIYCGKTVKSIQRVKFSSLFSL